MSKLTTNASSHNNLSAVLAPESERVSPFVRRTAVLASPRAFKSNFRRLMRRQISPRQRVARFGNHVDVRQVGLLHFPARFRLVFTVCFVSPLRFHVARGPAIFTARRRRFFFGRALVCPVPSSGTRQDILATSDTSLDGARLSQYPPVLCRRSSTLPSLSLFLSFLPTLISSFLPFLSSSFRCSLLSCQLRYKECLFAIFLVEPTFSTARVALNRINLPARFTKIQS